MTRQAGSIDPWSQRLREGLQLQQQGLFDKAESIYRGVVAEQPQHALAWHLLGIAKAHQGNPREALRCFQQSLLIWPEDPVAYHNLGNAFKDLGCFEQSLEASERAIARRPEYAAAWSNKAGMLQVLGRHAQACAAYRKVLELLPGDATALGGLAQSLAALCNWKELQSVRRLVLDRFTAGQLAASPFDMLWLSGDPSAHRRCARQFADQLVASHRIQVGPSRAASCVEKDVRRPIRVAYLSADFHAHATAYLMAQVFEMHDRLRVKSFAYSFGQDSDDAMRQRLRAAFDEFREVRELADEHVVQQLREDSIDIVVDLKGYTRGARTGILLRKPAPIVVNFLGYPGTMGHPAYDYIIGDAVVTPFEHEAHYAEKIVQMPHCYQPNDGLRVISPATCLRSDEGLPAEGFVFAAFNNSYKITPELFDVWMRLLRSVPQSTLWLISDSEHAACNLRHEAEVRGVAAERLVFAARKPLDIHLARHQLADLFLDALPINAHTTASDALWAGLPVVSCVGNTFAGRVAASLLNTMEMPELITHSLNEYEDLALELALDPVRLQTLKNRLVQKKSTSALFDAAGFAHDLESAYEQMMKFYRQGLAPQHFSVKEVLNHGAV